MDLLLVRLQLCEGRSIAQRLIRAGRVKVGGQIVDKPGTPVALDSKIELLAEMPFVSRGGEKLQKALDEFQVSVEGRICIDGGIATGGFTDCLLQRGAKRVYGVDVGYGQVAWKLRQDSRLVLLERTNFRYLTPQLLYGGNQPPADLAVMDLSFISLTKVLATLWNLLVSPRDAILLVKPQFEVGKGQVGKNGVVRDCQLQAEAVYNVLQHALSLGWYYQGLTFSPIKGPAGNVEYLLWLNDTNKTKSPPSFTEIKQLAHYSQKVLT
ncbi:MAG: TlyA family RNA methyltransferase [Geminocystis sp.]|nr:TlyA family RNA methyltransferase [Geminocystis sp.]MCS7147824.1 TlyA family RNA methyltransferase [Geminocystis sp.]MCX8079527.1 TlyA family RNA methyltransferase [Geminocystis sp.]MDW8116809.1 TlyA family RNA methyltransferase [Geminocystis sp.]MDW8463992.1 TlyA family RNA methyltransferase [Geminocystis sp.]